MIVIVITEIVNGINGAEEIIANEPVAVGVIWVRQKNMAC